MNQFIIRHIINTPMEVMAKQGTIKFDGTLWKNEVVLETELSYEEVYQLPFVLAIEGVKLQ
jgi:hypothetical protein